MTIRTAWHPNPGQTRADTRLAPIGLMTPTGQLTVRSGVIPGGTPLLLTGTGMSGSISTGRAVIQGSGSQGAYPVAVTAAEAITVANGHASLPRIDSVFLVVNDQLYDTSGATSAVVTYVQGTANASPVAPSAPATTNSALRLWDILVPAGASAGAPINWGTALTDRRVYTVPAGGITPDGTTAGSYAGQWRDGGGQFGILERYTGAFWESVMRLGTAGKFELGDTSLTRSATSTMQVNGNLTVTGIGGTVFARRTSDLSSSTTTMADDDQIQLAVAANAVYEVSGLLVYSAHQDADIRMGWSAPAGVTYTWIVHAQLTTVASTVSSGGVVLDRQDITSTSFPLGGAAANNTTVMTGTLRGLLVTSGTAGTLTLRWAQYVANGTASIMRAGTYVVLRRLA